MKALLFYLLVCLCAVTSVAAQDAPVINTVLRCDTSEILLAIKNGYVLQHVDVDSSIHVLKDALAKSRKFGFDNGIAGALVCLGLDYNAEGNEKESLVSYLQAMPYALRCRYNKELLATLYTGIGTPYLSKRDYSQAGYYYYKALQEVMNNGLQHSVIASHLYINLSDFWMDMGQPAYTLKYLLQSEKVALYNKDSASLIAVYGSLANFYHDHNNTDKAESYTLLALSLAEKMKNIPFQQVILTNMGSYLRDEKQSLQAIPYFQKAISLSDDEHAYQHNLGSYYNLAFCYYDIGDDARAKKFAYTAFQQAQKLGLHEKDFGIAIWILAKVCDKKKIMHRHIIGSINM